MKRVLLLLLCLLIVYMSIPTFAIEDTDSFCRSVGDALARCATPNVDGSIDDSEGWGMPVGIDNTNTENEFFVEPTLTADVRFAWDENGLYCAAEINDVSFIPSTGTDTIPGSTAGYNGDVFILAYDPLSSLYNAGYLDQDYNSWFCISLFEDNTLHMMQTQYDTRDLTSRITGNGQTTDNGWCFEILIPWDIIIEAQDAASCGMIELTQEQLAAQNTESCAAVIFVDKFVDPESREIETDRIITSAYLTEDGLYSTQVPEISIKTYGMNIITADSDGNSVVVHNHPAQTTVWSNPFDDVVSESWYYNPVSSVCEKQLFSGTSANTFSPNAPMTRAMLVTVLAKMAGVDAADYPESSFDDVPAGRWYSAPVAWAHENGIVSGFGNGLFGPDNNVTREQSMAIFLAFARHKHYRTDGISSDASDSFSDSRLVAEYFETAADWSVENRIFTGNERNELKPRSNITRAEASAVINTFNETPFKRFMDEDETIDSVTLLGEPISEYTVVYPQWASQTTITAANDLAYYIGKATGTAPTVTSDASPVTEREILVGQTNRESASFTSPDRSGWGKNDYLIRTAGTKLILDGGGSNGTAYAVYAFLEYYIGWRFTSHDSTSLYYAESIEIGELDEFRDCNIDYLVLFISQAPSEWGIKSRINLESTYTKSDFYYHSVYYFLGGPDTPWTDRLSPNPCYSDPVIIQKIIDGVRLYAQTHSDNIINVTQNDHMYYCKCDRCCQIYREEGGSHAGTFVRMANQVADMMAQEFPDRRIAVMPYGFSITPTVTQLRDNVIITPCTIGMCYTHPLATDDFSKSKATYKAISGWAESGNDIYIYDHPSHGFLQLCTNSNMYSLFSNFKFYNSIGAKGYFLLSGNASGEFAEMRAYLLSRLIWGESLVYEDYMNLEEEFLESYYGNGWRGVKKYLDFFVEYNTCNHYRHNPMTPDAFFPPELFLEAYDDISQWWNDASDAADSKQREHLERSHTTVEFMYQCYAFDEMYVNGDEQSRAEYIEGNRILLEKMQRYDISLGEGDDSPPTSAGYDSPPYTW